MPGATKATRTIREEIDRLFTVLRRGLTFWKRSLAVFLVVSLAAFASVMSAPRTYKSETVILYQDSIRSGDLPGAEGGSENARRVGARLREMLMSRAILEPLVREIGLYPSLVEKRGLVDAVDEMRKHITFRAREGDTFEIAFESSSRELAKEVARRLVECIVQDAASRRTEHAKTLKEFLDAESDRNKVDLKAKDAELAKFLAVHPEFARPTPSDMHSAEPIVVPPGAAITTGDPLLAALEWKAARLERQLRTVPVAGQSTAAKPSPPRPAKLPDSAELVAARKDVEDKAGRFTEKHPDVIAARARLRSAEAAQAAAQATADAAAQAAAEAAAEAAAQAAAEAAAQAAANEAAPSAMDENREELAAQLATLKAQIAARRTPGGATAGGKQTHAPAPADGHAGAVDLEVEFRRLTREANDVRERQRQLDDKQFKASIAASSLLNERNIQVSVLDPAYLPTHPSSRPRSTGLAVGLLVAFVLALLTALVSARLDDRIHDRIDLEALYVMPVLAVIPRPKMLPRKERLSQDRVVSLRGDG
ncbi:Lipopolysaccharide biosynthesis chain length determinant protein [Labilithrix luteola]|uniref:Lipopolysaccharide biosynthesis chain length determinant protein n=2 Tax=Labilithrix luteola TaxID=1391654 RepID=A0A0K1PY48_9BACT|nr:Lipopolysaccharide biosynthesis chain length determinant protein [Labilithrix luteola]